jgi:hypothetical protein
MIPHFPKFKKLELFDRDEILSMTKDFPPYSDFDFGSLFAWDFFNAMEISCFKTNLVIKFTDYLSGEYFFTFIGTYDPNITANTLLEHSKEIGIEPTLKLVPESVTQNIDAKKFNLIEDPDNTDYLISVVKLAMYDGPDFASKRRAVSLFERNTSDYRLEKMDLTFQKTILDIDKLFILWHTQKIEGGADASSNDSSHEYIAMNRCIQSASELNLEAYGLYIGDSLKAFWILGILNEGYSISHFEKADTANYQGIFPFFKKLVAQHLLVKGVHYINLEQDLGIPGLRQSKNSYSPTKFLKKYLISFK